EDLVISSRRRHTRSKRDWSSDVCSSDLVAQKKITVFKKQIHRDEKQIKQKEQTLETMELSYTNHQQTVEKLRATQTKFEMQLQSLVDQLTLADRNCEQLNEDKEH